MAEGGENSEKYDTPVLSDINLEFGHESVYDFYCMLCQEEGQHVEAKSFCVNCEEYMCPACCNYHRKSRLSRHHELLDAESMPKDTPLSERVDKVITTKCSKHATELIKYYCRTHEELGCATCFALGHRTCSDIESIIDRSENLLNDQEFKVFVDGLATLDKKSRNIIKQCDDNLPIVSNCYSEALASLKSHRENINTSVDVFDSDITAQSGVYRSEDNARLEMVAERCQSAVDTIGTISSDLQSLQASKKVCEIYITMMESRQKVKSLKATLENAESLTAINMYRFVPNMDIFQYISMGKGLGKLSLERSKGNPQNAKVSNLEDICVKSNGETERCLITGLAVMASNRLIIADFLNEKLKLLDTQSNVIVSELKVIPHPRDVAVIAKDKVVVTLESMKKILVLSITDTITIDSEIVTSGECRGVAYANDKLFITYCRPGGLEILNLSGHVIARSDNSIFRCPDYVCVSNNGNTIFVSDYNSCEVIILASDLRVKCTYSSASLRGPQKLCTDDSDNVYVCDYRTKRIHVIKKESRTISDFLTEADGLYSGVFSISHCRETNKLFIGMDGDIVKVYQLH